MLNNKYQFSTEAFLDENFSSEVNDFWQKNMRITSFESQHGGSIHCAYIKTGNPNSIVISQGRTESALKYKELAYDLNKQGYDIFLIDHRGQGFSSRLGGDAQRGHVQEFSDYTIDFNDFVSALNLTEHYQYNFLIAHSMGATIAASYLQQYTHPFNRVAFFSPMFSINLRFLPYTIAKIISYFSHRRSQIFNKLPCYALGTGPYKIKPFKNNCLTSSKTRYQLALNTFEEAPETKLGGPTMHWINRNLFACEQVIKEANKITIPVLLIEAGADTVVTSKGQQAFLKNRASNHQQHNNMSAFMRIEHARHEILIERDEYRVPALNKTLDFFQQYQ